MVARRSRPLAWASCGFRWTCSSRAGRCTLSTLRWGLCRVTPGSTSRCARRSGAFYSAGGCGAYTDSDLRSYTIIRVDVVNITSGLVFVDTRIIEYRRVINSVAINANGQNTHVGRGSIDSPRNGDGFGLPSHAGTCSAG